MPVLDTPRAEEFVALLRDRLPAKTFRHSLSVAELMIWAAEKAGVDRHKAVTAGLLHDLCKAVEPAELLQRASEYGIEVNETQRLRPSLLHAPVAAEEARRVLGVDDPEIHEAIYWHSTGKPQWCRLGLALYFSDFSEPLRDFPEAEQARRIFKEKGFEAALCYVADQRLLCLQRKPHVDPTTRAFNAWLHSQNGCGR